MRTLLAHRPVAKFTYADSSGHITSAAYVQVTASCPAACTAILVFNSTGVTLILALGGAGVEKDQLFYILPGADSSLIPCEINKGARVSLKANTTSTAAGEVTFNLFG